MSEGKRDGTGLLVDVIRDLPVPMVLFDAATGAGCANRCFAAVFASEGVDRRNFDPVFARDGDWVEIGLPRHDRSRKPTRVRAQAMPHGTLVIVDEAAGGPAGAEVDRLQQRIAELENLSATDHLTGAWNRAQLERTIDTEISRAIRTSQPVTLVLLDIDHFKRINDVHGHLVGDAVLKEFVARIRERMRSTDSVYRWGGEEFVVLAPGVGYRGAAVLAEDLRGIVAGRAFGTVGAVTASLGVAEYLEGEGAESWFHRTDEALYAAKTGGRNRVQVDRRGTSDLDAQRAELGVIRLNWLEAYECGEPTIDAEHRRLFELGNALLAAALAAHATPESWRPELDALLEHTATHFEHEEAILARYGFARLADHQRAHAALLRRARDMAATAGAGGEGAVGTLVNFLARDVVARHLFTADRLFYPLFQNDADSNARAAAADPRG